MAILKIENSNFERLVTLKTSNLQGVGVGGCQTKGTGALGRTSFLAYLYQFSLTPKGGLDISLEPQGVNPLRPSMAAQKRV